MTAKTLADSQRAFVRNLTQSDRATRCALQIGRELVEKRVNVLGITDLVQKELADFEIAVLEETFELLNTLSREQWRQREAIKLFLHGRVDKDFLRNVSSSWNGDPK